MKEYKVIPCPGRIIIEKKGTALTGLNIYKEIIDQETIGGWELVTSMTSEAVVKGKKKQTGYEPYVVLVFAREKQEEAAPAEPEKKDDKKSKKGKK